MSQIRSMQRSHGQHRAAPTRDSAQATRKAVLDALLRAGLASDADCAPLRLAPAAVATAPAQLAAAQSVDPESRRALVALYERCLRTYRDIARVQAPDSTLDDLGAALAFFVAVSLHALHGVDIERSVMPVLQRQLHGVSRCVSNWDGAAIEERQSCFERIAVLAVLVSGSCANATAQGPAAVAQVRRMARQYLQQLLGFNPDLLTLGADGLACRERSTPAQSISRSHAA